MRRGTGGLLLLMITGCASSGGDALMKQGAFVEAEAAYGNELAAAPGDAQLEGKRNGAREAAVRDRLEKARALRMAGHGEASLSLLVEALRLEDRWTLPAAPGVIALRDAEIGAAGDTIRSAVQPLLAAKAPLAAARRADKLYPLLAHPRLAPAGEQIKAEIAKVAAARCAELSAEADGRAPHLDIWVASYCGLLGTASPPKPAPEQRRGLRISGKLLHANPAQQRIFETWLADAFQETPWFAREAADMTGVKVAGAYFAELERRRVMLSAPYRDSVRSTIQEGLLGPTASVRTEIDRQYQYEAEQYDAHYDLDVNLTFELGDGSSLPVRVKLATKQRAYEHDVSFPPANVYPQRAGLPDINAWLTTILNQKKQAMVRKLRGRWNKAFCARERFAPDEAAQCLFGYEQPKAALATFETVFGPDATLLLEDFVRRGQAPKPAPAQGKGQRTPEIEETGGTSGETI